MSEIVPLLSRVCLHGINRDFIYVYILLFWLYQKISQSPRHCVTYLKMHIFVWSVVLPPNPEAGRPPIIVYV
jgi:hypothetical protein